MIRNIIFDIGGVLLDQNPKTYLYKLNIEDGKRKGLNDIIFHNIYLSIKTNEYLKVKLN